MAINGITGPSITDATTNSSTSNPGQGALSQNDFLKLLLAQVQNQDPLQPLQSSDFTNQLAQLSTVDQLTQLNTNFTNLLFLQQVSESTGLVGKHITYTQPGSPNPVTGTVDAVNINNGKLQLSVGGNTITLDQVTSIKP